MAESKTNFIDSDSVTFERVGPNQITAHAVGIEQTSPPSTSTFQESFITHEDETATLPNSWQLVAGTNVTIAESSPPGTLTVSAGDSTGPYDIPFCPLGKPENAATYPWYTFPRTVLFEANFAGSYGTVGTNPTSTALFTVKQNGSTIGTISVSTGGVVSFFTTGSPPDDVTFVAGDRMTLVSPTQDATLSDVAFTIAVMRTTQPYDIGFAPLGLPANALTYPWLTFTRTVEFAGNFSGSYGTVGTNPTATATFTVKKNGSTIGTIVVSTGGLVTFTASGGAVITFDAGDRMTLLSPAQDATLSDVAFTIVGSRI